ncbi:glycosyltransferase family 4 protein [Roseibium sediminis]|uniref:glycosyltransferase family 4 protein n=1 Tax=Roseibium sediminis TaxID=1775174 RepID=UPI00123CA55C|nr:glycosyltransferase family 4 protein [Roseibium sediminis]
MTELTFAYPGDIDTPTGGYVYDRRIIAGLKRLGWTVDLLPLGEGFPFPDKAVVENAVARLLELPEGRRVVVDGLAYGVLDEAAARLGAHLDLTALVHHPLCKETGLSADVAEAFLVQEKAAVRAVGRIIVTSPATAMQVSELFGIAPDDIHVVLPGTEAERPSVKQVSDPTDVCVRLLCVATVTRRKGYDLLIRALSTLTAYPWHLDIVGDTSRDPACFAEIETLLAEAGLQDHVTFHGAVTAEELPGFYASADIFVLASRYEGYGMAFTEALAHGLPVIGSGGGAVRDTLPDDASIYCETDDVEGLRAALEQLISSPARRQQLSSAALVAAARLPSWSDAADRFAKALTSRPAGARP